jgi:hypothetical protein
MFPHPTTPTNAAPALPRPGRLRRALDVVIAFATLADAAPAAPAPEPPALSPVAAIPPATAAARARAGTRELVAPGPGTDSEARSTRAARRAFQPAATARGAQAAARATQPRHPHRRSLHAPARIRRPCAVRAAPQPCLTPLPARHAGHGRTQLAPSR